MILITMMVNAAAAVFPAAMMTQMTMIQMTMMVEARVEVAKMGAKVEVAKMGAKVEMITTTITAMTTTTITRTTITRTTITRTTITRTTMILMTMMVEERVEVAKTGAKVVMTPAEVVKAIHKIQAMIYGTWIGSMEERAPMANIIC